MGIAIVLALSVAAAFLVTWAYALGLNRAVGGEWEFGYTAKVAGCIVGAIAAIGLMVWGIISVAFVVL